MTDSSPAGPNLLVENNYQVTTITRVSGFVQRLLTVALEVTLVCVEDQRLGWRVPSHQPTQCTIDMLTWPPTEHAVHWVAQEGAVTDFVVLAQIG